MRTSGKTHSLVCANSTDELHGINYRQNYSRLKWIVSELNILFLWKFPIRHSLNNSLSLNYPSCFDAQPLNNVHEDKMTNTKMDNGPVEFTKDMAHQGLSKKSKLDQDTPR